MSPPTIRLLEARFDLPLRQEQVPQWRGAFAAWVGLDAENGDLFHNHANGAADEYHHRYPQAQYRSVRGKATLVALNEGIEAVAGLFQRPGDWNIRWEGNPQPLRLDQMRFDTCEMGLLDEMREYRLLRWLALNEDNYQTWRQLGTFRERVELLDRILVANLLSLCTGLGWKIPRRFEAHLTLVERIGTAQAHGVEVMTFDCRFATDLVLPVGLGMGKSSSLGFGVLLPTGKKDNSNV